MNVYPTLMNRGFLIFEADAKFVLAKMPTPADPRNMISDETQPESSLLSYDTFDEAINCAKRLIDWKEDATINTQDATTTWKIEMMYRHRGLGIKFVDLGEMGVTPYANAVAEGNRRAEAYIKESNLEKSIDSFEIRVRPCRKQN